MRDNVLNCLRQQFLLLLLIVVQCAECRLALRSSRHSPASDGIHSVPRLQPEANNASLSVKARKDAAMVVAATAARMPAKFQTCLNSTSCKLNGTFTSEQPHTPTKDGACQCLYGSDVDDQITEISAFTPMKMEKSHIPADLPMNNLPPRGSCWLVINAGAVQTAYNVRIIELAVCELMSLWKPDACEPACAVTVNVPQPRNPDDLNSTAACIALAIYSRLNDNPVFQRVAVIGGLTNSTGILSSVGSEPETLSTKLEAAHKRWYHRALIPASDKNMYRDTDYFDKYKGEDRVSHYPDLIVNPCKTVEEMTAWAVSNRRI